MRRRPTAGFFDPPGWTKWIGHLGWALAIWLFLWPAPYLPLLLTTALLPPITLAVALRWPDDFAWADEAGSRLHPRRGLELGWMMPSLALAVRAITDVELIDIWLPLAATAVVGALPAYVAWRLTADRNIWQAAFCATVALIWVWAVLNLANVYLDRSPGVIAAYQVTGRHKASRSSPSFQLRSLSRPEETISSFDVPYRVFERTMLGDAVCLETNPGLFGWRTRYLVDCIGPARDLSSGLPKPFNEQRR